MTAWLAITVAAPASTISQGRSASGAIRKNQSLLVNGRPAAVARSSAASATPP